MLGARRLLALGIAVALVRGVMSPGHAQSPDGRGESEETLHQATENLWSVIDRCTSAQSSEIGQEHDLEQAKHCFAELTAKITELETFHGHLPISGTARAALREGRLRLFESHSALRHLHHADQALRFIVTVDPLTAEERARLQSLGLDPSAEQITTKAKARPQGRVEVRCTQPCEVWVNWIKRYDAPAQPKDKSPSLSIELPYGKYTVAVVDPNSQQEAEPNSHELLPLTQVKVRELSLNKQAKVSRVSFKSAAPVAEPKPLPGPPPASSKQGKTPPFLAGSKQAQDALALAPLPVVDPILPRPYLQTSVGIGLLGVATGSALMAANGYCTKGGLTCASQDRFKTKNPGIVVLSVGGAVLSTAVALLIAERIRGKRALREGKTLGREQTETNPLQFGFSR